MGAQASANTKEKSALAKAMSSVSGKKFEDVLNENKEEGVDLTGIDKPTEKEKSDLLLGKMTMAQYKAKKQKEKETKDLLSSTKPTEEQKSDLLLGKTSWDQYLNIKQKEKAASIQKDKATQAQQDAEAAYKQELQNAAQAQAASKAKYSSYSPFAKSDMPTATQFQNPYPEYLFKGKAPDYGRMGGNFMAVTGANQAIMQQKQQEDQAKLMQEQDKIKQLFAMIAQSKQGQQPPVQG